MENPSQGNCDLSQMVLYFLLDFPEWTSSMVRASFLKARVMQIYAKGVFRSYCDYLDLLTFNAEIGARGFIDSLSALTDCCFARSANALWANLGQDIDSTPAVEVMPQ